jgi:hypothetical protein
MIDIEDKEWLSVAEVAEIIGCSIQNIHYLIKGRYRPQAKRKKISPRRFLKTQTRKTNKNNLVYFIHKSEIEKYLKGEKS